MIFSDLCQQYLSLYAKPHKKTWRKDWGRINKYLLPRLGGKQVREITVLDCTSVHAEISETKKTQANRVLELLTTILEKGIEWGVIETNPARRVRHNRERPRRRFASKPELASFLQELDKETAENQVIVKLLILTGLRVSNVLSLEWRYVHWDEQMIFIPDTKNDDCHAVFMCEETLALMQAWRQVSTGAEYVFEKPNGRPRHTIRKAFERVRAAAGLEDFTTHDLRRTCGTYLAMKGYHMRTIANILGQKSLKSAEVYVWSMSEIEREALTHHGSVLTGLGLTTSVSAA